MRLRILLFSFLAILICAALFAQQTGSISGKVTTEGVGLPGVTVEARSNILPQPRVTVTDSNGEYRLPQLPPGSYTVTFSLSGMQTVTRKAEVLLGQNTPADVTMGVQAVSESITVTAEATLVDKTSTQIETGISQKEIQALPVSQNYGDLQKLIPGVMYTQDAVRGPSAGGSGQDNVYLFDGVNITMPLFGVLVAEPNTHDISQVNIVKGGAKAIDFNRAGGFLIDSVSKSGTNRWSGELGYQVLNRSFVADPRQTNSTYAQDRNWTTVNAGGPILPDRLFVYGSYYRPYYTRSNQANLYGPLPKFTSKRNEEFGKLTFTPTQSWLIHGTYRYSHRVDTSGDDFGTRIAPTAGSGSETKLQIGTLETSWIVNPKSFATFKFTDFRNPGFGRADILSSAQVSTTIGTQLDINNFDKMGRLSVPTPLPGNTTQNAFVQPFIDKYGYVLNGVRTGGGIVGYGANSRDDDSFFRKAGQFGYNYTLGSSITHELHVGYQRYNDAEDLVRASNGWGLLSIPAGVGAAGTCPANACGTSKPAFFVAAFQQQGTGAVPKIHSEFHSQNIELNDTIQWSNWSFNLGVLASNDVLYGQGLAKADNIAGFVKSPGTKYKMHEWGFGDMIQPRLGATWAYDGRNTVWSSYARYNPAANSDARAASWDRGLAVTINAFFDANGKLIGVQPNRSSTGKLFQPGIKPPQIDEYMIGTARQLTSRWSGRLYGRYRHGTHYVEDTPNDQRLAADTPASVPHKLYIPDFDARVAAIGNPGLSYVIANLDGAFTKYLEATAEQEWRGDRLVVNGSYTWSHYYGNFDQDNTTSTSVNDMASFIGSSFIGDGPGRQIWNFRYGDLRGDRRHVLKLRSTYFLPWRASAGAFAVYQSGQPYQLESVLPYRPFTGSTNDNGRLAEPAGSRRSPSYYDLDLNYTQNFPLTRGMNLQFAVDVFNATNNQEGYNYETRIGTLGLTTDPNVPSVPLPPSISPSSLPAGTSPNARVKAPYPNTYYAPRRFQIAARIQF
ncbi:MAG TPA: carboxypeptidase regulatory-like domain-containing protein [Thermoanaerobaculia bacterium]|jgi:hypothetical protein|nr:carboxypeptidase regulatory-like domain-containing protein [Thermoanaerobaculia bacterium]